MYCYDPCPALGDCCSTEEPKGTDRITENSEPIPNSIFVYNWFTWVNKSDNKITLVQNYIESQPDCGGLFLYDHNINFFRENCQAKHKPLCMKGSTIKFEDRKRKSHKKNKKRKSKKKNAKTGKRSSGRQGRQLTDTGRPIEMCATVLPALVGNHKNKHCKVVVSCSEGELDNFFYLLGILWKLVVEFQRSQTLREAFQ